MMIKINKVTSAFISVVLVMMLSTSTIAQTSRPTSKPTSQPESEQTSQPKEQRSASMDFLVNRIEHAHGKKEWQEKKAVEADLVLEFGGKEALNCKFIYDMHTSKVRMELKDGTTLVFDGEHAWVSPSESETKMARFHLLTWPYFLAAPFKLNDPGTNLEPFGMLNINNIPSSTAKLTFDKGIGDAPDDWYIIYPELGTDKLLAMAYIVSYGKDAKEAEKEPHAIVYHDYKDIEGVMLSTRWTMHHWSKIQGAHGDPIGKVKLSNIKFIEPDKNAFTKPQGAREDKLPDNNK